MEFFLLFLGLRRDDCAQEEVENISFLKTSVIKSVLTSIHVNAGVKL
jgi:hypothetical protein